MLVVVRGGTYYVRSFFAKWEHAGELPPNLCSKGRWAENLIGLVKVEGGRKWG